MPRTAIAREAAAVPPGQEMSQSVYLLKLRFIIERRSARSVYLRHGQGLLERSALMFTPVLPNRCFDLLPPSACRSTQEGFKLRPP